MYQNEPTYAEGLVVDGFKLIHHIGSGGTAEVWEAEDANLNKWAIKIFSPKSAMDEITLKLFRQQFTISERLEHPNILRAKKYGIYQNRPYIIFDLCETSLMQLFNEKRHAKKVLDGEGTLFSESQLAHIIKQVSDALAYLHQNNIVHQDIKPDNILIRRVGEDVRYVISDFGVSTELKMTILRDSDILKDNNKGLTPDYAAPELYQGNVFPATDIFAFGITLYELCCGRPPVASGMITTAIAMLNNRDFTVPDLPSQYSQRFNCLVKACLKFEPNNRTTASQLSEWADFYLKEGYWDSKVCAENNVLYRVNNLSLKKYKWIVVAAASLLFLWGVFKYMVPFLNDPVSKFEKALKKQDFDRLEELYQDQRVSSHYPQYDYLAGGVIEEGRDPVATNTYIRLKDNNDNWGVVDQDLNLIIPMKYDMILKIYDPMVITVKDGNICLQINIKNKEIKRPGRCVAYKSLQEFNGR